MKVLRKKSMDPAVNQLLIQARRQGRELVWDRLDAMQPQCGFGRLGICCAECCEGPCRVNPFDSTEQSTVCGRTGGDLAAASLLRRVRDGYADLAALAQERGMGDAGRTPPVRCPSGAGSPQTGLAGALADAGQKILAVLEALAATETPAAAPASVRVNLGALAPDAKDVKDSQDAANIMLLGHVQPEFTARLRARAAQAALPIRLLGVCGNEGHGPERPALLTNYDSQELPLLTGAVDMIVAGSQCVMPATLRLAATLGIPVAHVPGGPDDPDGPNEKDDAAARTVSAAAGHKRARLDAAANIPPVTEHAVLVSDLRQAAAHFLSSGRQGTIRGVVYLGGCGNAKRTQDKEAPELAGRLLEAGLTVVTAGCAGTSLAKAGMCRPEYAGASGRRLPGGLPPVLHLGACHEAGKVRELAALLPGLPFAAVFPEIVQNKTLAAAVGLAAAGLPVLVGAEHLPGLDAAATGNLLRPVEDLSALPGLLASFPW
jgi:hydroxylamine reductase (hybrid-cluster protein)